ncbi:hypothetical protein J2Z50_006585 [Ensifer mexicanus]|nr:hypothetical protein [Sinorhizobium mexicanum]
MWMALEGQSQFLPCGVPYWGFDALNDGASATVPYDYDIGVDYHKSGAILLFRTAPARRCTQAG